MSVTHTVILAVAGSAEARVARAVDAHPELTVVRRCADLAEAAAAAAAGVGTVVVLSDQPRLTRAVIAELLAGGTALVGVPSTAEAGEQLRALGIASVAAPSADGDQIAAAIAAAATHVATARAEASAPATAAPSARATVIAVWGPTGAPGRTTVAVNVAAELAADGARTLLVDADTYGGAVAQACGLTDESPGIAAVARAAQHGSLDQATLMRLAPLLRERLHVMTGITRASRWTELSSAALDELWASARTAFDAVVIDCGFSLEFGDDTPFAAHGPRRNAATASALRAADVVIAVGTAEPLGVQRLINGLSALGEVCEGRTIVAVNRVRASVAGARPQEAIADALVRFAGVDHTWMIPHDPHACDAATLAGQVLAERAPRSKVRRAIGALAREVAPAPPGHAAAPRQPRPVAASVAD